MEFLHSFLRRHLTGKPAVASLNVGCFLRLYGPLSVPIKRVEFRENVRGFLSPGTKQTVRNNEVSVKLGLTVVHYLFHTKWKWRFFICFKSFRFGPEIAYVASCMLDVLKGVRNKTIVGGAKKGR